MEIYIEDKALYDYAASLARLLPPTGKSAPTGALRLLRQSIRDIGHCRKAVLKRCGNLPSPPPACQWLLDNYHLARREYLTALDDWKGAGELRCCADGLLILCLCRSLTESSRGQLSEERCRLFLDGFQSVRVLQRQELELFPAALKLSLLEALAEACRELCRRADTEALTEPMEALFTSLRLFSVLDTERLLRDCDVSSAILSRDPSGDYARMDRKTQGLYLQKLQKQAQRQGLEEHEMAAALLQEAKEKNCHVGFLLFERPRDWPAVLYIAAVIGLTLVLALGIALHFDSPAPALLLFFSLSELVKNGLDFVLLHCIRPRPLPRMDLRKGIPAEGKSLCVITSLLCSPTDAREAAEKLERFCHASRCREGNLLFGILADLPAADSPAKPGDEEILSAARQALDKLNRRYGGGFYLFSRERVFDGERYSGYERKRGAIGELMKLLDGQESALRVSGNPNALSGCRYLISLDSDTEVYPGSLQELIGAMLHPLNRPVIDESRQRVVAGHGLLHPRIATELQSSHETDFALIFSGSGGSDPYGSLCGELYMDAFQSGGFAGKGILDVKAFLACGCARLPEGRILSHDALEGAYLRGGYMGDVEFCDRFPAQPLAWFKRLHRWTRGDWQNAPWIFRKNLAPMDRWRLLDSLRRSLVAPATLLALLLGFTLPQRSVIAAAAWAALLALLSRLLLSFAEESFHKRSTVRLRRYTRLLTGTGAAIVQSFMRLWLLPYEAWICLSAACTALWRMLVSRKKLLQWQTAAQCSGGDFADHIQAMFLPMLLGFLLLLSAPTVIGRAAGLLWLLSPAAASAMALPAQKSVPLGREDRDYLQKAAADTWQYLRQYSSSREHFLPPDNVQEQPATGPAPRSSPTNIGFAMASAVAAVDLGCESREGAIGYLSRITDTLEKLPRCKGHLYNWYDTRSLRPLEPCYVSTVDSGNFYAALLVVRAALQEWGQEELAGRIQALLSAMDFAPLYDKRRGLFHICYDPKTQRGMGGWYDLMASEAMLTSYLAIAKGDVPVQHWRRLSRGQLQKDGFRGLASWTGTMFEYLMPELFLPFYPGSLLWESARFCVYAQRQYSLGGRAWGSSESAFFALDSTRNYGYKAHGCPALALKRGQEADQVVSPYSSFLALSVQPGAAVKNLRRLEGLGARGRFGFYEALDFSPDRCRRSGGELVRCYMAHHVGMSVLASANLLCQGSIQKRFLKDAAMAAHSLLLQEQLPHDSSILQREESPLPPRGGRSFSSPWQLQGEGGEEKSCLLSNGSYHLCADNRGGCYALWEDLAVYQKGSFSLSLLQDGRPLPLLPAQTPPHWELGEDLVKLRLEKPAFHLESRLWAAAEWGQMHEFAFQARQNQTLRLQLSLKPLLAKERDYESHPAFWKLGLRLWQEGDLFLLQRLRRGQHPERWLALGFDRPCEGGPLGWLIGDRLCFTLPLPLKKGGTENLRFGLCAGLSRQEARDGLQQMFRAPQRGCMVSAAASRLSLSAARVGASMELLGPLLHSCQKEAAPRQALWPYGVSGDYPLLCCPLAAQEALSLLDSFLLLKCCGMETELVYLSDEQGEYHQPLRKQLCDRLDRLALSALLGARAGVHIVPGAAQALLESRAACFAGREPLREKALLRPALSAPRAPGTVPEHAWQADSFSFDAGQALPGRSWQQLLTNGRMGAIVRDTGPAALWLDNARELRLLPPPEDIESTAGSESLWLALPQGPVSPFAANDGFPCRVQYGMGWASWEKDLGQRQIACSIFLMPERNVRVLLLQGAEGLPLHWTLQPSLSTGDGSSLSCRVEGSLFRCENPESQLPGLEFLALGQKAQSCRCDFCPGAMHMELRAEDCTVLLCGCESPETLRPLLQPGAALAALEDCQKHWRQLLGGITVQTGFVPLDRYVQPWALYQTLACRLWGRSSLYQSGGAYGFRDQLQDSVNLLLLDPVYAREQILACCRHQYEEGDVMHWWHAHPKGDKGLRSRCSDDLLWLPWALCRYCRASGDYALCAWEEPYLHSQPLREEEADRYETAEPGLPGTVLEHARAALDCCVRRGFGPHGLPFFGSGDWNDGLDAVDGESVWLGWFLSCVAHDFSQLLERLSDPGAPRFRELAQRIGQAANASFNGSFYRRGYHADGSVLGGEHRLDSLPQSFAAFCPYAETDKVDAALDAALEQLVDKKARLVQLFDPPYSAGERYCGYLSSYGEGFRENGGQYTHGAIWLAMALFARGRAEDGFSLLKLLLPSERDLSRYEAEPYVLAADVYAAEEHRGRAGWTWYTGSSGWYFRAVTESMLGLRLEDGRLQLSPCLPRALPCCHVRWKDSRGQSRDIAVRAGEKAQKFTE